MGSGLSGLDSLLKHRMSMCGTGSPDFACGLYEMYLVLLSETLWLAERVTPWNFMKSQRLSIISCISS